MSVSGNDDRNTPPPASCFIEPVDGASSAKRGESCREVVRIHWMLPPLEGDAGMLRQFGFDLRPNQRMFGVKKICDRLAGERRPVSQNFVSGERRL